VKLNKQQLKRIIREERAKLIAETKVRRLVRHKLREVYPEDLASPLWEAFENATWTAAVNLIDTGMDSNDVEGAMLDSIRSVIAEMDSEQALQGRI
jgi:hypothetical protein